MELQTWIVLIIELIGTVAFSVSGAMVGMRKQMDIFGVIVLGVVTAVGGGMMRDVFLGQIPGAFTKPVLCRGGSGVCGHSVCIAVCE